MARAEDGQGQEDALRGHHQDGRLNQSPENAEHLHDVPDVGANRTERWSARDSIFLE